MIDDVVTAELLAIEDEWSRAMLANDADQIARCLHPDWVLVSESGVLPAARFLALVSSGELTHAAMESTGERRVRVYGDTAVVTARMISTAGYQGAVIDADEWTTDVFVRHGGRWLCTLTQLTPAVTR